MTDYEIRRGRREDCVEIRRLIQELADFEKMPDGPKIDAKTLERDGFDTSPPLFHCFVIDLGGGKLGGYALYNITYSTWQGKRFWLEDITVSTDIRRQGIGSKLMLTLIKEAVDLDCKVMNFNVLDWNPAEKFYKNFGAQDLTLTERWHFYTVPGDKLKHHSAAQL